MHGPSDVFMLRDEDSNLSVSGKSVLHPFSVWKVEELETQSSDNLNLGGVVRILPVRCCPKELKLDQLILFVCLLKVGLVDLDITTFSAFIAWADSSNNTGSSMNTKIEDC